MNTLPKIKTPGPQKVKYMMFLLSIWKILPWVHSTLHSKVFTHNLFWEIWIAHLRIGHMVGNPEVGNPESVIRIAHLNYKPIFVLSFF